MIDPFAPPRRSLRARIAARFRAAHEDDTLGELITALLAPIGWLRDWAGPAFSTLPATLRTLRDAAAAAVLVALASGIPPLLAQLASTRP